MVPPGSDNPLGEHALILDIPGYLLHGTNRPAGVGMRVSSGCVRLYPEDIAALFPTVSRGTPVRLINQPVKNAWQGDVLYAEVHPLHSATDYTGIDPSPHRAILAAERSRLVGEAAARGPRLDPLQVQIDLVRFDGLPKPIGKAALG